MKVVLVMSEADTVLDHRLVFDDDELAAIEKVRSLMEDARDRAAPHDNEDLDLDLARVEHGCQELLERHKNGGLDL